MKFSSLIFAALAFVPTLQAAEPVSGVQLGRTRLFMEGGAQTVSFELSNWNPEPVLVSSWVEALTDEPSDAFMTSPSLMQIAPKRTASIRIEQMSALPADRESVFWLTVRSVPAVRPTDSSRAIFGLTQKIKLHYRPKGLKGDTRAAAEALRWSLADEGLSVNNPTPFSLSFLQMTAKETIVAVNDMCMPYTVCTFPVKGEARALFEKAFKAGETTFTYIDEFGGDKTLPMKR